MTALAKLQIAKKELHLHDDDYRAILERVTGQRSAKGMSEADIVRVLDVLKTDHGWVPTVVAGAKKARKAESRKARRPADSPTAKKARAMWISLWQMGAIRDSSESALETFAKRQLKVDRLVWADEQQMYKLIEGLKAMATRAGWPQSEAIYDLQQGVLLAQLKILQALPLSKRQESAPIPLSLLRDVDTALANCMNVAEMWSLCDRLAPFVRKAKGL